MSDSEDEFVLSDVIAEANSFVNGELEHDIPRILWLIDALLIAAYDDPSEIIINPAFQLCELMISKKQRLCQVNVRKAQCYFHQGSYVLARQTLDEAETYATNDSLEREVLDFRQELYNKVTRDGKMALFILGGAISAVVFWWLSRNKRNREATSASVEDSTKD